MNNCNYESQHAFHVWPVLYMHITHKINKFLVYFVMSSASLHRNLFHDIRTFGHMIYVATQQQHLHFWMEWNEKIAEKSKIQLVKIIYYRVECRSRVLLNFVNTPWSEYDTTHPSLTLRHRILLFKITKFWKILESLRGCSSSCPNSSAAHHLHSIAFEIWAAIYDFGSW